jgi:cobalt/nickel transport system ATP-binding protein
MTPALEFRSVSIRYSGSSINTVENVSFCIQQQDKVALFGLNGSGKTTLLLASVGLLPFSGEIFIDGITVEKKNLQKTRERTGFLFNIPEDQILFPRVLDDVAYGLIRRGAMEDDAHEKARFILEKLGIVDFAESSPFQLSHGQRQRIALAGALINAPSVILLDEPSSALDPPGRRSLANFLSTIDSSLFMATHDIDFASHICNRFMIIQNGTISECADINEAEQLLSE